MNTDIGNVLSYSKKDGYGFVARTLRSGHRKKVYFRINSIKRGHPDLAERLDNEWPSRPLRFWYQTEDTDRGEQVLEAIQPEFLRIKASKDLPHLVSRVEKLWLSLDESAPDWLYEVTIDLVGLDRAGQLRSRRAVLQEEKRRTDIQKYEEQAAARRIEELNRKAQQEVEEAKWRAQREIEEEKLKARQRILDNELEQLVSEMKQKNFKTSADLSEYIRNNNLRSKYKNISGVLQMTRGDESWDFEGGISPALYRKLCERLNLGNRQSGATPGSFTPFKDL